MFQGLVLARIGRVLTAMGRAEEAAVVARDAVAAAREVGDPSGEAAALDVLDAALGGGGAGGRAPAARPAQAL